MKRSIQTLSTVNIKFCFDCNLSLHGQIQPKKDRGVKEQNNDWKHSRNRCISTTTPTCNGTKLSNKFV